MNIQTAENAGLTYFGNRQRWLLKWCRMILISLIHAISLAILSNPASAHPTSYSALFRTTVKRLRSMENLEKSLTKLDFVLTKFREQVDFMRYGLENAKTSAVEDLTLLARMKRAEHICPNCDKLVRHKRDHFEIEIINLKRRMRKMEAAVNKFAMTLKPSCVINDTEHEDGDDWQESDCIKCTCLSGTAHCHPIGCIPPTQCTRPRKLAPGECCPSCGLSCWIGEKWYEDGDIFWLKPCLRCECNDGSAECSLVKPSCPNLTCEANQRIQPFNGCCQTCVNDDPCASKYCHSNAFCTNDLLGGFQCTCLPGFVGDGHKNCFDIDECGSISEPANSLVEANNKRYKMNSHLVDLPTDSPVNTRSKTDLCGARARCLNVPGSYRCECLAGFIKMNDNSCIDPISMIQ